ncbi:helix-turn-helix transcriptional regulator [Haloferacaceae archaeon DSL9]
MSPATIRAASASQASTNASDSRRSASALIPRRTPRIGRKHSLQHHRGFSRLSVSLPKTSAAAARPVRALSSTTRRLEPLIESIYPAHQEFVVEPFANATVTGATLDDPYKPVSRVLSLLGETETLRGFNTTHVIPPMVAEARGDVFGGTDVELIHLPSTAETLLSRGSSGTRAAIDRGDLTLRIRGALPYGLALFDDRVGIGGYDEATGALGVFVDTDDPVAVAWAHGVYETYRGDSTPLGERSASRLASETTGWRSAFSPIERRWRRRWRPSRRRARRRGTRFAPRARPRR